MTLIHSFFDRQSNDTAQPSRIFLLFLLFLPCLFHLNEASSSQYYKNTNTNNRKSTRRRNYHYTGPSSTALDDSIDLSSFDSYYHHSSDHLTSSSSSSSFNIGGNSKIPINPIALPNYENVLFEDHRPKEKDYEEDRILQALARTEEGGDDDADEMTQEEQQQRRRRRQSKAKSRRRVTKKQSRKRRVKKSTSTTTDRSATVNVTPPVDEKKKTKTKKDKTSNKNDGSKILTGTPTPTKIKSGSSPVNNRSSTTTKSRQEITTTLVSKENGASTSHRQSTSTQPPSVNSKTSTSSPVPKTKSWRPLSSKTSSSKHPPTQSSSQKQQSIDEQSTSGIFVAPSPVANNSIRREEKMTPTTKSTTLTSPKTISTLTSSTTIAASSPPLARTTTSNFPKVQQPQQQQQHAPVATAATASTTTSVRSATATHTNATPWIRKFLSTRTKDVLFPIPKEYLSDGFNLAQLAPIVERIGFQAMGGNAVNVANQLAQLNKQQQRHTSYPIYRLALQCILDEDNEDGIPPHHPLIGPEIIQTAAEALYLLVHARFAASPRGLEALRRALLTSSSVPSSSSLNINGVFGKCPRPSCQGCLLLPYGSSNNYSNNQHKCQRYCPCCGEAWMHWESRTDGCAWGPSLAHLLLLAHGKELYNISDSNFNRRITVGTKASEEEQNQTLPPSKERNDNYLQTTVVPRVMGFRIHPATIWGKPLMEW